MPGAPLPATPKARFAGHGFFYVGYSTVDVERDENFCYKKGSKNHKCNKTLALRDCLSTGPGFA
jgi:hypothetical protein